MTDLQIKTRSSGSESGHWYGDDGLVTAVPSADGKRMIAPDIRHARKFGLVPSVTGILGILDKPALTTWKCKEFVRAAGFVGARGRDEPEEEYFVRVQEQFCRYNDHAAVGTDIHGEICKWHQNKFCGALNSVDPVAIKACEWLDGEYRCLEYDGPCKVESEKAFANRILGFGGTVDWKFITNDEVWFIDFKTTDDEKIAKGAKLAYPESHLAQLAAYDLGTAICEGKRPRYFNIFIGRVEGAILVHEWTNPDEVAWAKRYFLAALEFYKTAKKFN